MPHWKKGSTSCLPPLANHVTSLHVLPVPGDVKLVLLRTGELSQLPWKLQFSVESTNSLLSLPPRLARLAVNPSVHVTALATSSHMIQPKPAKCVFINGKIPIDVKKSAPCAALWVCVPVRFRLWRTARWESDIKAGGFAVGGFQAGWMWLLARGSSVASLVALLEDELRISCQSERRSSPWCGRRLRRSTYRRDVEDPRQTASSSPGQWLNFGPQWKSTVASAGSAVLGVDSPTNKWRLSGSSTSRCPQK